jgi:site-specific recombinase XerD
MPISLSQNKLSKAFYDYLSVSGISSKSLKFYVSDLSHFTGWVILKVRSWGVFAETLSEILPFIDSKLAREYRSFLLHNDISPRTVNRRLSTLRHLARFFVLSQLASSDFMDGIENIDISASSRTLSMHPLIAEFEKKLEADKVSPNTIKNYLSDIKHFINWLETRSQQTLTTNN